MVPSPAALNRPTPLWAALSLTFLCSVGTGIVTNGIYFLTEQGFGFTRTQNYLLGLLLGVTYIVGSLGAGPGMKFLRRAVPGTTARSILVCLLVLLGLLSALPAIARWLAPAHTTGAVWALVALYSPLTGVLWPMVESFIAGGRRGHALRSAMGIWNVVWSGAIIVAYLAMAPVIHAYPTQTLLGLAALHLGTAALLPAFPHEPGTHGEVDHDPHPPIFGALLVTFRMLLPMAYVVSSALVPYLPTAMADLGVPRPWHTILGTAWLIPRTVAFFALERWHGWHGRWSTAVLGGVLLIGGFAASVLAPAVVPRGAPLDGPDPLGIAVLLAGLAAFGAGMAVIYTAAIYYAMEVGHSGVHAGGTHEALIGVGYSVGPLCGVLTSVAVDRALIPAPAFNGTVLGVVGAIATAITLAVFHRVARRSRP